jgi:hypothetical protein
MYEYGVRRSYNKELIWEHRGDPSPLALVWIKDVIKSPRRIQGICSQFQFDGQSAWLQGKINNSLGSHEY